MYDWLCLQKAGALRAAAMVRDVALTEMLLTAGADPNSQNPVIVLLYLHAIYLHHSGRRAAGCYSGCCWVSLDVYVQTSVSEATGQDQQSLQPLVVCREWCIKSMPQSAPLVVPGHDGATLCC